MRFQSVAMAMVLSALSVSVARAQPRYTVTTIVVPDYPYGHVPTGLSEDGWVVGNLNVGSGVVSGWMWRPNVANGTAGVATVFVQDPFLQFNPTAVSSGPSGHYITLNNSLNGLQGQRGYVLRYDLQNNLTVYGPTSCFNPDWAPNYPTIPRAVNSFGDVAGSTGCAQTTGPAFWSSPYTVVSMPFIGGEAYAINNQRQMTGNSSFGLSSGPPCTPTLYSNCSNAYGLAYVATPGSGPQYLPPMADAEVNCTGLSINDAGEVAGTCIQHPENGGGPRAWIYSFGQMIELSCLSGDCVDARATGINNHSVVVGTLGDTGAFVWDRAHGIRDLNTMVPAGTPLLSAAIAINDAGQILVQCGDNSHGTLQPCLLTPVPTADLSITTVAAGTATVGDTVTYAIGVSNAGPDAATGVTVTETLAAGATFVSATPSAGNCSGAAVITCSLGGLAANASTTVTVLVTATAAGTLTSTTTVTSDQADPVQENNSASAATTVNRRTPVVSWNTPATITYGTPLSGAQLNASADTAGSFAYAPSAGVLSAGPHTLSVTFTPNDSQDFDSVTASVTLTVNPAATTASIASSSNPATFGQAVTFTAAIGVVAPGAGTPTGNVTFSDGGSPLGSAPLDASGHAAITTSSLSAGPHQIAASYQGDANFSGSAAPALTETISANQSVTPGEMRGDAFVRDGDTKYDFELLVRESAAGADRGYFTLHVTSPDTGRGRNRVEGRDDRFVSRNVASAVFSDDPTIRPGRSRKPQVDTVLFSGIGDWNGRANYRYEVFAQDAGEPGRHRESVRLTITDPSGRVVAHVEGDLDGGNVQSVRIHP